MNRVHLIFVVLFTSAVIAIGQGTPMATDSLAAISRPDGSRYIVWKAGTNTTMESVMFSGRVEQEVLIDLNPILLFRPIKSGDILLVPLDTAMIQDTPRRNAVPVWYTVKGGESVFAICRRQFGISEQRFLEINNMAMPELRNNQEVIIGWYTLHYGEEDLPIGVADYLIGPPEAWSALMSDMDSLQVSTERGVAFWNKSHSDVNMFAMHRAAPVNTYILITNPMFGRSVMAKVVGTIPPTYPEDVSVIITPGVAKELGAIDSRFYAEMSFVSH